MCDEWDAAKVSRRLVARDQAVVAPEQLDQPSPVGAFAVALKRRLGCWEPVGIFAPLAVDVSRLLSSKRRSIRLGNELVVFREK